MNGYLDDVPLEKVADFERGFHEQMRATHREILDAIHNTGELDEANEQRLKEAIEQFKGTVAY